MPQAPDTDEDRVAVAQQKVAIRELVALPAARLQGNI